MRKHTKLNEHRLFSDKHTKKRPSAAVFVICILAAAAVIALLLFMRPPKEKKDSLFIRTKVKENEITQEVSPRQNTINVFNGDDVVQMPLEEYITGVVAAEMPASYNTEALKAQAVAARTYTLRKAQRGGCKNASGADICTDSNHCQAYSGNEKLKERWGDDYQKYMEKISAATQATAGEILTYNGEVIEALFCASAGGMTENAENVYSIAQDYLKSVESPDVEGYVFEKIFSKNQICSLVKKELDETLYEEDIENNFKIISRYPSGRVKELKINKTCYTGKRIRGVFELSSANFDFVFEGDEVVFTSVGHGHGIGMSQAGANVLAKEGMTYDNILLYYYQGVNLEKIRE